MFWCFKVSSERAKIAHQLFQHCLFRSYIRMNHKAWIKNMYTYKNGTLRRIMVSLDISHGINSRLFVIRLFSLREYSMHKGSKERPVLL